MRASKLMAETRPLAIQFDSGDLNIVYWPNAVTSRFAEEVNDATAAPGEQAKSLIALFRRTVKSWDLEDDEGNVIPLDDDEKMFDVGTGIMGEVFRQINTFAQSPGKARTRS